MRPSFILMRGPLAVAFMVAAFVACDTSYSVNGDNAGADGGRGGSGHDGASTGDGAASGDDGSASEFDANLPPIDWPSDFPTHFPGLKPTAPLTDLGQVCAVDTTALTYKPCNSTTSKTSPNLFALPAGNVAAFFFDTAIFGSNVRVTGTRGLVIVVGRSTIITGGVDASANLSISGPGGDALQPTTGQGKPADPGGDQNGGGGAGHATKGADGAFSTAGTVTTNRGVGGAAYSDNAQFVGGARGGAGNYMGMGCGSGGGAGGALQISSLGSMSIAGNVLAGGGGGGGGCFSGGSGHGGAGGGSGGLVYLESRMSVSVQGAIAANGGGGGGGPNGQTNGPAGQDGQASSTPAFGGGSSGTGGGGGAGGAAAGPTTPAGGLNAGGGGGAAGQIFIFAPTITTTGTISPNATMM